MTESEVSTEIVRLERAVYELKREYQNLLNQSSKVSLYYLMNDGD